MCQFSDWIGLHRIIVSVDEGASFDRGDRIPDSAFVEDFNHHRHFGHRDTPVLLYLLSIYLDPFDLLPTQRRSLEQSLEMIDHHLADDSGVVDKNRPNNCKSTTKLFKSLPITRLLRRFSDVDDPTG